MTSWSELKPVDPTNLSMLARLGRSIFRRKPKRKTFILCEVTESGQTRIGMSLELSSPANYSLRAQSQ